MKDNHEEIDSLLKEFGFVSNEFSYIQSNDGLICHLEYSKPELWKNNSFEIDFKDMKEINESLKLLEKKLLKKNYSFKDFNLIFKTNKDMSPNLFLRIIITSEQ